MAPRDRPSLFVQTGGDSVEEIGPVHIVLDVFLAGPDDLDRTVDVPGDLDGASDAIDLQPTTEAATDQMITDHDLVQRQTRGLRRRRLGSCEDLVTDPDLAAVPADMKRAVPPLHC